MWRNSKRLLECAAEVIQAQSSEPRQRCKRYLFRQVLLDIVGHHALLPRGEASPEARSNAVGAAIRTRQLLDEHGAQRLEIGSMRRKGPLDQALQLLNGDPQFDILEEHARREEHIGDGLR